MDVALVSAVFLFPSLFQLGCTVRRSLVIAIRSRIALIRARSRNSRERYERNLEGGFAGRDDFVAAKALAAQPISLATQWLG